MLKMALAQFMLYLNRKNQFSKTECSCICIYLPVVVAVKIVAASFSFRVGAGLLCSVLECCVEMVPTSFTLLSAVIFSF